MNVLVHACFAHALDADSTWDEQHMRARRLADTRWVHLNAEVQHEWMRCGSPHLSRLALQQAAKAGQYSLLVERGKRHFQRSHESLQPAFDPEGEARSHGRVITALRAVQNARSRESMHLVHACLSHRSDAIVVAAAATQVSRLRFVPNLFVTHPSHVFFL